MTQEGHKCFFSIFKFFKGIWQPWGLGEIRIFPLFESLSRPGRPREESTGRGAPLLSDFSWPLHTFLWRQNRVRKKKSECVSDEKVIEGWNSLISAWFSSRANLSNFDFHFHTTFISLKSFLLERKTGNGWSKKRELHSGFPRFSSLKGIKSPMGSLEGGEKKVCMGLEPKWHPWVIVTQVVCKMRISSTLFLPFKLPKKCSSTWKKYFFFKFSQIWGPFPYHFFRQKMVITISKYPLKIHSFLKDQL